MASAIAGAGLAARLLESGKASAAEACHAAADPLPVKVACQRRILVVVSEWGYWGEELVAPVEEFDKVGYQIDFCTPTGKRPNGITVSQDPGFVDPPLGRTVTTSEMADKAKAWDDPATPSGRRLESPRSLAQWFPARPYFAAPDFVRKLEAYNRALDGAVAEAVGRLTRC